jgi:hypothetical protein
VVSFQPEWAPVSRFEWAGEKNLRVMRIRVYPGGLPFETQGKRVEPAPDELRTEPEAGRLPAVDVIADHFYCGRNGYRQNESDRAPEPSPE